MIFRLLAVYGAFEALLLLGSAVFGRAWFYSSQVAFAGSLLVLAATFRAYKKRVENGVRDYDASADDDIDEKITRSFRTAPLSLNLTGMTRTAKMLSD